MKFTAKNVAIVISGLVFLFVTGLIINKSIDFFTSPVPYTEADLRAYLVQVIANILTLIGWLIIVIASILKGDFNDIEKPKIDILEKENKIQKYEQKIIKEKGKL